MKIEDFEKSLKDTIKNCKEANGKRYTKKDLGLNKDATEEDMEQALLDMILKNL